MESQVLSHVTGSSTFYISMPIQSGARCAATVLLQPYLYLQQYLTVIINNNVNNYQLSIRLILREPGDTIYKLRDASPILFTDQCLVYY